MPEFFEEEVPGYAGETFLVAFLGGGADVVEEPTVWGNGATDEPQPGATREPEDLVPVNVAVLACRRYAQTFLGLDENETKKLTDAVVTQRLAQKDGSLWDALESAFTETFETDLGKAGFAKELLAYLAEPHGSSRPRGVPALDKNFATLIRRSGRCSPYCTRERI